MLNQRLQQKLLQKLSPQQILLMKLLQIPTMALEQRIKQEIEENPALEETSDPDDTDYQSDNGKDGWENDDEQSPDEEIPGKEDIDLAEYFDEEETPSYRYQVSNTGPDDQKQDVPFADFQSFHESLIMQLGFRNLGDRKYLIGLTIIGNLDDSGYLQRSISAMVDDLAFTQNLECTEDEIVEVLSVIQDCDPPGVGARDLKECLILQLKRLEEADELRHLAMEIIQNNFEEFIRKHYDKILRKTHASEDQLKNAIGLILKLNPKPGNSLGEGSRGSQYIIPDFNINIVEEVLELSVNSRNAPELRVNRTYLEMLESFSVEKNKNAQHRDALVFIKAKIDSAKWFIEALRQRENTLLLTMKAIMDYQREYFLTGDETKLRPMILKDIAEVVGLDISTVSRVANSKYVQTPYGTFLLKSFFSESMQTESGVEVSTREVKKILEDCIKGEKKGKPLTDEELTEILKQKGYNIARRTVAKYREQLNIPVARLRKTL